MERSCRNCKFNTGNPRCERGKEVIYEGKCESYISRPSLPAGTNTKRQYTERYL